MPCSGPFQISHIADYTPYPDVRIYILVCDVELIYTLVHAAASLFCACLVSVHVSISYVIAGSTQKL